VRPRLRVGIFPAFEHRARARLWGALEGAYPVCFVGRVGNDLRGLDASVVLGMPGGSHEAGSHEADSHEAKGLSEVEGLGEARGTRQTAWLPCLRLCGEEREEGAPREPGALALAADPALARPLRGALLGRGDAYAPVLGTVFPGETVLATLDGGPAWVRKAHGDAGAASRGATADQRVACAPAELEPEEALRERLRPGRCLAVLALTNFLGEMTVHLRPPAPALRAAFLIDDPNLRRPRYGHLDYPALLRHARLHGYHLAVAMVPLDARLAHPRAVRCFREGSAHLSLCVHGNDHDGPELGRLHSDAAATAVVAQALRRSASFERRTGVAVERVMVPPHERVSEHVAWALRACGFQGLTTTRPYPWVADTLDRSWLARPPGAGALVGWEPVEALAGGLPVLLRADFRLHPREDLVLRAFLGQPLILYGHHDLLADGPDALAEAAGQIDRLGEVRWCSLGSIASALAPPPGTGASTDVSAVAARGFVAGAQSPRHLPPLLRRLLSEGRDRAQSLIASTATTQSIRRRPCP
jgi:hypothetical protein